jgi:uncharacterized membrane protein YbhN (UPF0104 family)
MSQRSGTDRMRSPRTFLPTLVRVCRSRRVRIGAGIAFSLVATAVGVVSVRHYMTQGWPLSRGNAWLIAAAGVLFLLAFALKGVGWRRLVTRAERPGSHALAAANAAASVTGLALPGRFDDLVRVAVARRLSSRTGVGALCLSLVLVGLIDSAALTPLASVAAGVADVSAGIQAGLAVVGAAGIAAAAAVLLLPRVSRCGRLQRFRLIRWVSGNTACAGESTRAWAIVSASWLARATALYILLGAVGIGHSFPLALLFLCASAAASVLPLGPAGAATQAGSGAAVLAFAGVPVSNAVAFALAAQALLVLAAAAVVVAGGAWEARLRLATARA